MKEKQLLCFSKQGSPKRLLPVKLARFFIVPLLFLLFFVGGITNLQAQTGNVVPGANPTTVVKMGDSLTFTVGLTTSAAVIGTTLEVTMPPVGFEILPSTSSIVSIAPDRKSAVLNSGALSTTSKTMTIYVKAFCDAEVEPLGTRVISYDLKTSGGVSLRTATSASISNFNDPIFNVPVIAPMNVNLGQANTRIIQVTQTAPNSHLKNMKVNVTADKTGITISKIEISSTGAGGWVDVTASALVTTPATGYTYLFNRANAFGPAPALNYAGAKLSTGQSFYIRETYTLTKCTSGLVNYGFEYGDGTTYCGVVATAAANAAVVVPAYVPDFERTALVIPTGYGVQGYIGARIINNSAAGGDFKDVFTYVYGSDYATTNVYRNIVAVLMNGTTIVDTIPLVNNIAISGATLLSGTTANVPAHANIWKTNFSGLNKPAKTAAYIAAGLSDLDGDGTYSDIQAGKTVNIRYYYENVYDPALTTCSTGLPVSQFQARAFFKDVCNNISAFTRAYTGPNSTHWMGHSGTYAKPIVSIANSLLSPTDQTTLLVEDQNGTGGNGWNGFPWTVNATRVHKIQITLPVGLDYRTGQPIPIKVNTNAPVNATNIVWTAGTRVLEFQNPTDARGANTLTYTIPVEATGVVDLTKEMTLKHTFQMAGDPTGPVTYNCFDVVIPYTQKTPCSRLELVNFTAERTSFGWEATDEFSRDTSVRATRTSPGIDLQAVGPYDNVTFTSDIDVNSNISLAANENVMVELNYLLASTATYFNMPNADASRKIILYYDAGGIGVFTQVAEFKTGGTNSALITTVNTNPDHRVAINIASFIGAGKAIPALTSGDKLRVVFQLQGTTSYPQVPADVVVTGEVYTQIGAGAKNTCYPLVQTMKVYRYDLTSFTMASTDYLNANQTDIGANFLRWQIGGSGNGISEVFPNEYRPNVLVQSLTVTVNALVTVDTLMLADRNASVPLGAAFVHSLIKGVDYTVTYSGGKTIVTLVNPPLMRECYFNYAYGYCLYGTVDLICVPDGVNITTAVSVQRKQYPTSATTAGYTTMTGAGALHMSNGFTDSRRYRSQLATSQATVSPAGREAQWNFTLTNQTAWAGTDPTMPFSWMAFECDPGVVPTELRDVTGSVVLANASQFVNYAPNKYWVKLGTLNLPASRNYSVKCTYTTCTGTPGLNVIYGMNKVAYPDDPAAGYNTVYNSPGYFCNSTNLNLKLTPPTVDFGGTLVHNTNAAGGTNRFCDTVGFTATYINGTWAEVSNMRLNVALLPEGMNYSGITPQVRRGNGSTWTAWTDVQGASQTTGLLEIVLGSGVELAGVGSGGNHQAQVRFTLRISCGMENAIPVYADFIGESGCGAPKSKKYNSGLIKIYGLATPNPYYISGLNLIQTPFTGGSNNGDMTLTGTFTSTASTQAGEMAIIDLPPNVTLLSQSGTPLFFTQEGQRLKAPFIYPFVGTRTYSFNLTLRPSNPAEWDMDSTYIYVSSGLMDTLTCDGSKCALLSLGTERDSVTVSMQKLEVCFDYLSGVSASQYNDPTTERVAVEGTLVNSGNISSGRLIVDLYTFDGIDYVPVNNIISGNVVANVPSYGTANFRIVANIQNTENMCDLKLMLRRDNTASGAMNPYLSTDTCIMSVPAPVYKINTTVDPICQMAAGVVIGELPISDYQYKWTPATHLNRDNVAQPTFSYDYINYPVSHDTILQYMLEVIRPGGCSVKDTVFVPLKGLASVADVADMTLCNDGNLSVTFTDPTGSGTIFSWAITNGPSVGLPASGTTPTISGKVRNTGTQPVILQIQVTPKKNGCDGVTKMFFVTVNPKPQINYVINQSYCSGQVVPAQILAGNLSSAIYRWQHVSGTSVMTATSGINVIPGFIANNTTAAAVTGTYRAFAEYDNGGVTCYSDTVTFTLSIDPSPVVNSVVDQHICNGGNLAITFSGTPSTNIYYWQKVSGATIPGLANNGSGNISVTGIANTTPNPFVAVYKVTPTNTSGTCIGIESTFTITVYPTPSLGSAATAAPICSGTVFNYTATSTTNGLTYGWRRLANAGISEALSTGSTAVINEKLTNTTQAPVTVQYEYTMTQNTYCAVAETISVVVNPVVDFALTNSALSLCSGTASSVNLGYVTTNTLANLRYEIIFSDAARGVGFTNVAYTTPPATNLPIVVPATAPAGVYSGVVHVRFNSAGAEDCKKAYPFDLTIKETPTLTSSKVASVCSGEVFNYTITSSMSSTLYSWNRAGMTNFTNPAPKTGTGAQISETMTLTAAVNTPFTFKGYITMISNGCSNTDSVAVTVNPKPVLNNIPSAINLEICSSDTFNYATPTSNVVGATITWERLDAMGIDQPGTSGTGTIKEKLTNNTASPISVTYEFTLSANGCDNKQLVRVVVNPGPALTSTLYPAAICSGITFNYTARSSTKNVVFSWTRNTLPAGVTGTAASGSTANISDILTSTSTAPQTVSYVVRMTIDACYTEETVEVIVNPIPAITSDLTNDAICSGETYMYVIESATSGMSYIWRRMAVAGITPSQNFGVVPYINETLSNSTTAPIMVTYTISAEANGCTTTGITKNVVVNPSPTIAITNVSPMLMNVGGTDTLRATSATGVAASTTWSSSNPLIVSVSNTGFKTEIVAHGQGTAVVTVTTLNASGCPGTASIVVNVEAAPTATLGLASGAPAEVCNNGATTLNVLITGGTAPFEIVYTDGTKNDTVTALTSPWPISVTVPTNTGLAQATVTYSLVSVKYGSGISISSSGTAAIKVNPTVAVGFVGATPVVACEGSVVPTMNFNTTCTETTKVMYDWTNDNPNIGLPMSGQAVIPAFLATNPLGAPTVATITVTPRYVTTLNSCPGVADTYTITVNPKPSFMVIEPAAICQGDSIEFTAANVTAVSPAGSVAAFYTDKTCLLPVTGKIAPAVTTTYYVRLTSSAPASCPSDVQTIEVTVKPLPELYSETTLSVCSGTYFEYEAVNSLSGVSYKWSRAAVSGVSNPTANGSGARIRELLTNTTGLPVVVDYILEMTAAGCTSYDTLNVTVNPKPELTTAAPTPICNETNFVYAPTFNVPAASLSYGWERLDNDHIFELPTTGVNVGINEKLTNTTANPVTVSYQFTLNATGGCDNQQTVKVIVNPTPELSSAIDAGKICSGETFTYRSTSATKGTTFEWQRVNVAAITPAAAAGKTAGADISETLTNSTPSPVLVKYAITMTANGCTNIDTINVVVGPKLGLSSTLTPADICSGDYFIYQATSLASVRFTWERAFNVNIDPVSNTGNSANINERLVNLSNVAETVTYHITMTTSDNCQLTEDISFQVNPLPVISVSESPVTMAAGATRIITITDASMVNGTIVSADVNIATATFNTATGAITIVAVSPGSTTLTYETQNATGCINTLVIPVFVTAAPLATLDIIGANTVCSEGTTELYLTNIQNGKAPWFIEINHNLGTAADIVYDTIHDIMELPKIIPVTLPANTSLTHVKYTYSVTKVTDSEGSERTAHQGRPVVTVLPVPTVNTIADQEVCHGSKNEVVYFTGAATNYRWTADKAVGIDFMGDGNKLPAFTLTHNSATPEVVTITVTPEYSLNGVTCVGGDSTFTITVNPLPQVTNTLPSYTLCNNANTTAITFTGIATEYRWEASGDAIGLPSGIQTGNFGVYAVTNTTGRVLEATITVTPVYSNTKECFGSTKSFTITVIPTTSVEPVADQAHCIGTVPSISLNGVATNYRWTVSGDAIGLTNGSGMFIPSFTSINATDTVRHATVSVTPEYVYGGHVCQGTVMEFVIHILPASWVNFVPQQVYCHGATAPAYTFTGGPAGTVEYQWRRVSGDDFGLLQTSGVNSIPTFTATNTGVAPLVGNYEVTPVFTFMGRECSGAVANFRIVVNPAPIMDAVMDMEYCHNTQTPAHEFTSNIASDVNYIWTRTSLTPSTVTGLPENGYGIFPSFLAVNTGATAIVAEYEVRPEYSYANHICVGAVKTFKVTIQPAAVLDNTADLSICSGDSVHYALTSSTAAAVITWVREQNLGINEAPLSGTGNIVDKLTNNTNGIVNVRYVVTLASALCTNTEYITVTVSPRIDISNEHGGMTASTCSEAEFTTTLISNVYGTSFTWERLPNANVQEAVSNGTTEVISEVLTNLTNAPVTVRYAVVATAHGCTKEDTLVVTLSPKLTLTSPTTIAALCSGEELVYGITSTPAASYTWERLFNGNVTPHSATGTGDHIAEVIYNDGTTVQPITYVITMNYNGCTDTAIVTGSIKPLPKATLESSAVTMALGSQMDIAITSGANANSSVVSLDPTIVGAALNGSRDAIVLDALEEGTTIVRYSVTDNGCTSIYELTVTVSRTPLGTLKLLGDDVLCSGGSTILEIYTIEYGKAPWTVVLTNTASPAWDTTITINNTSGFRRRVPITLPTNTGSTVETYYYSIASVTDANGAVGTSHDGYIPIHVLPEPKVTEPIDQVLCNNTMSEAVYFNGVATVYNWEVDKNIGLQLRGSNDIASFRAINTTTAPITATITVTPEYRYKDKVCTGTAVTFTITVNPTVAMHAIADTTVCADENVTIALSGATDYRWNAIPSIGLPAGTGTAIVFKAKNNTQNPIVGHVVVTPINTYNGMDCEGESMNFTITVNPVPEVSMISDLTYCDEEQVPVFVFNGNNRNATYVWTRLSGDVINGLPESGMNEMPAFKAVNKGTTVIAAEYGVIAYYGIKGDGAICESDSVKFTIRIYPALSVPVIPAQEYCPGEETIEIDFRKDQYDVNSYYWTQVAGPYIGLSGYGKDIIPSFTTENPSNFHAAIATIEVVASMPEGMCTSKPYRFDIVVHERPILPSLYITGDTILSIGEQTTLTIETAINGIFHWYGDPAHTNFLQDGRFYTTPILYVTTSYYITMLNAFGCESENHAKVTVHVGEHDLFIPEVITPNGDGYNDYWVIKNIDNFPKNHVTVVNRWGTRVFEKTGYSNNNPWACYPEGNMVLGGGMVPRGTYFYRIALNDGSGRIYTGFVEVVY